MSRRFWFEIFSSIVVFAAVISPLLFLVCFVSFGRPGSLREMEPATYGEMEELCRSVNGTLCRCPCGLWNCYAPNGTLVFGVYETIEEARLHGCICEKLGGNERNP